MPRPILRTVAGFLVLGALGSFTLGVVNAPERGGRLPGERRPGEAVGPATAINATEATPLSQERIEGPPPVEKPAVNAEDDQAEAAATPEVAPPRTEAAKPPATTTPAAPAPEIAVPPPEEPPH